MAVYILYLQKFLKGVCRIKLILEKNLGKQFNVYHLMIKYYIAKILSNLPSKSLGDFCYDIVCASNIHDGTFRGTRWSIYSIKHASHLNKWNPSTE